MGTLKSFTNDGRKILGSRNFGIYYIQTMIHEGWIDRYYLKIAPDIDKFIRIKERAIEKYVLINKFLKSFPGSEVPVLFQLISVQSCTFCTIHYEIRDTCSGCPIKERTGLSLCKDTPYVILEDLFRTRVTPNNLQSTVKRAIDAVEAEILFLKSLRVGDAYYSSIRKN